MAIKLTSTWGRKVLVNPESVKKSLYTDVEWKTYSHVQAAYPVFVAIIRDDKEFSVTETVLASSSLSISRTKDIYEMTTDDVDEAIKEFFILIRNPYKKRFAKLLGNNPFAVMKSLSSTTRPSNGQKSGDELTPKVVPPNAQTGQSTSSHSHAGCS